MSPRVGFLFRAGSVLSLLPLILTLSQNAPSQVTWSGDSRILPIPGASFADIVGDLEWLPDGAAAVYSQPDVARSRLVYYRFDRQAVILAERTIASENYPLHAPSLCFDGANLAVTASAITRGIFLVLSPDGATVLEPFLLPDIPTGGRAAAFRVLWTGTAYAVFGCWLEPESPFQDPAYGPFYTHLRYWLIQPNGQVQVSRELRMLAPMSYPGIYGAEKTYYDVVWTGQAFFLAYFSESETGPPFSTYACMYDLGGNEIRAEAPAFANTTAKGPVLAFSGDTLALTALKEVTLTGNFIYVRFFDPAGNPLGPEVQYNSRNLGFGPTVSWQGDRFVTAYSDLYDPGQLTYAIFLNSFTRTGARIAPEYVLQTSAGIALQNTMALGVDLELVGNGFTGFGKGQSSDAYLITVKPLVFGIAGDAPLHLLIRDILLGRLIPTAQQAAGADRNQDGTVDIADLARAIAEGN
jgi:hypothetical protein